MTPAAVNEQQVLDALRKVPTERWTYVLHILHGLSSTADLPDNGAGDMPICTAADLLRSQLVGLWADRTDLSDSRTFARRLRFDAEHRSERHDAAGH